MDPREDASSSCGGGGKAGAGAETGLSCPQLSGAQGLELCSTSSDRHPCVVLMLNFYK